MVADLTYGRRMGQSPKKWWGRCDVGRTAFKIKKKNSVAAALIVAIAEMSGGDV